VERFLSTPAEDIPSAVRRACAEVAAQSSWVHLDEDRLARYAVELAADGPEPAGADEGEGEGEGEDDDPWSIDVDSSDEDRIGLVLALSAINFGSGYHPVVAKRPGLSGARTMAAGLRDWAAASAITAMRLVELTPADAHDVFQQPPGDDDIAELMALFATALNDLGDLILARHDGSFTAFVAAADGRAAILIRQLDALPYFRDVATYRGRPVPFYKRAQLAVSDLDHAFGAVPPERRRAGHLVGAFDVDQLTAFADNLVPHVLRIDGVLRYEPSLTARIDAGILLPSGSEEEVEIRALGVHAVERLCAQLDALGAPTRPCALDQILWWRGRLPRYKAVPRHRTRTYFY
jgi:Potential Queuosine, Q, salvage protein family